MIVALLTIAGGITVTPTQPTTGAAYTVTMNGNNVTMNTNNLILTITNA